MSTFTTVPVDQAAVILSCSRQQIIDMIVTNEISMVMVDGCTCVTITLDEPAPAHVPEPATEQQPMPKPRARRPERIKLPTKQDLDSLVDTESPVRLPPGRMRPIREPEPEPMWVEFPPPLVSELPEGWMSLREAAGLLRVGIRNVKTWVLDDRLESTLYLGRTLVSRNSVRKHSEQFE